MTSLSTSYVISMLDPIKGINCSGTLQIQIGRLTESVGCASGRVLLIFTLNRPVNQKDLINLVKDYSSKSHRLLTLR